MSPKVLSAAKKSPDEGRLPYEKAARKRRQIVSPNFILRAPSAVSFMRIIPTALSPEHGLILGFMRVTIKQHMMRSAIDIMLGLWKNRLLRWCTIAKLKGYIVRGRISAWMRTGNGGIEPRMYCLLNEMQVLVFERLGLMSRSLR